MSLNDVLLTGPDLTNSLLGVLLRFRRENIALTADIESMFYCFQINENHRNYLRFIWYQDNDFDKGLIEYRMKFHVTGNSPSPAVATYGLHKTAELVRDKFGQDVVNFVKRDFYVADALTSLPTVNEAIDLGKRTQQSLAVGGNIRLHKIVSNSQEVIRAFPSSEHAKDIKDLDLGYDSVPLQRSLDLSWDLKTDSSFQVNTENKPFTRRGVLSTINSIFDPIGFAAPVTIRGKMLLRQFMTEQADRDDTLPPHYEKECDDWKRSLLCLEHLQIPRVYSSSIPVSKEILIFADASESAIAAVAHMKTTGSAGNVQIGFILGKAKLDPSHGHTIPRLELCATVLAVIAEMIFDQLDIELSSIRYFSDSKVVFCYLNNQTRRFFVYVSNRVEQVRTVSSPDQWNHILTHLNPADAATRGISAIDMQTSIWLNGPDAASGANNGKFELCNPDDDHETRPKVTTLHTNVSQRTHLTTQRFQRFSSWNRLIIAVRSLTAMEFFGLEDALIVPIFL